MVDQLIYISTARHALPRRELPAILDISQRNNRLAGVTGILLFDGIRFLQALEGDERCVDSTFERIRADARHRSAVVLSRLSVASREFGSWDMAYEDNMSAPGAVSLFKAVDALVAPVENRNTRELFRSFARVDRYVA
jgi:hypothetical protein